ncbi:MAG: ABC transporter six-transmembrane domain-containing protein [Pseudomonadota bacterium]
MISISDRLSLGLLIRIFRWRVCITWGLMLIETALFAVTPLLIGWSIDGLLNNSWTAFFQLLATLGVLLVVATGRRMYDTRAYGTMRVELAKAQAARSADEPISVGNARVLMGRELVYFLENTAPEAVTALVQIAVSIVVLLTFHGALAASSTGAIVLILILYSLFARRFFSLNAALNEVNEHQVTAIETRDIKRIASHFVGLRREEVRLSDTESIAYGLIFFVLLTMLAFNLWFGATQMDATPGQIFAIVSYSLEYLQSAVQLPVTLQALTRLQEITERINRPASEVIAPE